MSRTTPCIGTLSLRHGFRSMAAFIGWHGYERIKNPVSSADLGRSLVRGVDLGREHAARADPALCRLPFADPCLGHCVVRRRRVRSRFGPDIMAISAPRHRRCRRPGQYPAFRERRKRDVRDPLHLRAADAGRCIVGAERMRKIALSAIVLLLPRVALAHGSAPDTPTWTF